MRLVLCDDHSLFLDALRCALEDHGHTVLAATTTPGECVEAVRQHQPQVCLLDLYLGQDSGLDAVPAIRQAAPATAVVVLSGQSGRSLVSDVLAAGAIGLLRKDQPFAGIAEALRAIEEGRPRVGASERRGPVPPQRRPVDDPAWLLRFLTEREQQVLRFILEGHSTGQMAARLGVAPSTARTHVQSVLQKLGVHSRLQAAARMRAAGAVEVDRSA